MRLTISKVVLALSASALFSAGCGANAPTSAHSFTKVYAEVLQPKCTNDFCHFNNVSIRYSALDLSTQVRAYWSLVGLPSMGPACSQSGMRVVPWDADHSVMYKKVLPSPPCGAQMPADSSHFYTNGTSELKFSGNAISNDERQLIYDWIQDGAQND